MSVRSQVRSPARRSRANAIGVVSVLALLALAAGAVQAQNAARMQRVPKSGGLAPPANALTRDQLRECMALEARAGTESDTALHAQTLLSADKARHG